MSADYTDATKFGLTSPTRYVQDDVWTVVVWRIASDATLSFHEAHEFSRKSDAQRMFSERKVV